MNYFHHDENWVQQLLLGESADGGSMSEAEQRALVQRVLDTYRGTHKLTVNRWAKAAGVGNSLYNFMNKESHSLSRPTIQKLVKAAKLLGVPTGPQTATATSIGVGSVTVRGDLSAGMWREAIEWDITEQFGMELPVPSRWAGKAYGLRIIGRSMNEKWPDSTIVLCVPFMDYGFELESGEDYVVVHRRNAIGLVEATAKRYELHGNEIWLCPESTDQSYQPVKIPRVLDDDAPQAGVDDIYIHAVILGGYGATRAGRR